MILVGNQRGHGQNLASHLLSNENDFVEIHEVRGFVSHNLHEAFAEAEALLSATRAKHAFFSLSLSPPTDKLVEDDLFESAIDRAEKELNLEGQPRVIVFHEKMGPDGLDRRHAHCVWSRIDPHTLKARPHPHSKLKLNRLAKDLFLEHGWDLPAGFNSKDGRDPNAFDFAQAQQAQRLQDDPAKLRGFFREAWKASNDLSSFDQALLKAGFKLARGERRGFVIVDSQSAIYSVSRWTGTRSNAVRSKLGSSTRVPSVDDARKAISRDVTHSARRERTNLRSVRHRMTPRDAARRAHLIEQQRRARDSAWDCTDKPTSEQEAPSNERTTLRTVWNRILRRGAQEPGTSRGSSELNQNQIARRRKRLVFDQLQERIEKMMSLAPSKNRGGVTTPPINIDAARHGSRRNRFTRIKQSQDFAADARANGPTSDATRR